MFISYLEAQHCDCNMRLPISHSCHSAAIVLLCTHDVLQFKKFVVYEVVGDAIKRM